MDTNSGLPHYDYIIVGVFEGFFGHTKYKLEVESWMLEVSSLSEFPYIIVIYNEQVP